MEWERYTDISKYDVIKYIENLNGKYHPNTHAFIATGPTAREREDISGGL